MIRQPVHLDALTGLRGVAVALVVLSHMHTSHLAVGGYGVDVFFVLSGFLITHVLLRQQDTRSFKAFLGRRVARLLPALLVTVLALAGWVVLTKPDRGGTCLALAATHLMDLPFHMSRACPGPLHITWSLAAEEQFYLVWPWVVWRLSRRDARQSALLCFGAYAGLWVLSFAIAHHSADTAGWWNFFPAGRPTAVLLGAGLAFVVPLAGRRSRRARPAAALFLAGLFGTGWLLAHDHREVVLGPLIAVPAALLIVSLVDAPDSWAGRFCRSRPLLRLGELSYALYLVHVLVLHLARDLTGDDAVLTNAAGAVVALLLAAALRSGVEQPLRRRGYAWVAQRELVTAG